jgi:ubiquinone biosynthesis protein
MSVMAHLTRIGKLALPLAAAGGVAYLVPWRRVWSAPGTRWFREEAGRSLTKLADAAAAGPSLALNAVRHGFLPAAASAVTTAFHEGVSQLHWKALGDALVRFARSSGPVLTKVGQVLATRSDVLPEAVCERLQALYARQPAMTGAQLTRLLGAEFPDGLPFRSFDRQPIGVGSIGQVHRAQLCDGRAVVVKLLRPGVERQIDRDLNALELLVDLSLRMPGRARGGVRSAAARALRDLGTALRSEVDLRREADAIEEFGRRFATNPRIRVPGVHRQWSSRRVLVMEELQGEPLSAIRARAKSDPEVARRVASLAIREILTQVFDEGRFHADPHAGNLLLLPDGRLGLIDLGLVGETEPQDRRRIAGAVRAFMSGDPDVLSRALLDFGTPPDDFDFETFRSDVVAAIRAHESAVVASAGGVPATGEASRLEQLVNDLFRVAYAHELRVPRSTTLLIKTVVTAEGVARSLDPDINIVAAALPIMLRSLTPRWLRWRFW